MFVLNYEPRFRASWSELSRQAETFWLAGTIISWYLHAKLSSRLAETSSTLRYVCQQRVINPSCQISCLLAEISRLQAFTFKQLSRLAEYPGSPSKGNLANRDSSSTCKRKGKRLGNSACRDSSSTCKRKGKRLGNSACRDILACQDNLLHGKMSLDSTSENVKFTNTENHNKILIFAQKLTPKKVKNQN
mgnify:CR=1 FL=1